MGPSERLPDDVVKFITDADTVFIASIYASSALTAEKYPSHAGMNARGGLPGFMRVRPSDSRTVVLPDYSGNQNLSSLGNIESTRLAGLTVVSFTSGDVLYLTGTAKVLVGAPAFDIMPRQASITTIETTGYAFIRNALPIRQEPGTDVGRSPYSPKIKYLLEEPEALATTSKGLQGRLISAVQFSSDIAIFRFEVTSQPGAKGLKIRPGQAIVLDFMDWIGPPVYQHMADNAPGSINDDRVRTWTVSSAHEDQDVTWFELTMREMKGGTVTGALFNILRQHPSNKWEHPVQINTVKVLADIVGVTGDFYMEQGPIRMLLVAGGIGVTPFLSMLTALADGRVYREGDVVLVLATREPELFLKLLKRSLYRTPPKIKIRIELFTSQDSVCTRGLDQMNVKTTTHKGRIQQEYWRAACEDRDVFICGPGEFGDAAVAGLRMVGVPNSKVYREGFF
jgi:NAD(P)H-flavin reductase